MAQSKIEIQSSLLLSLITIILWHIWKERNRYIFYNMAPDPMLALSCIFLDFLHLQQNGILLLLLVYMIIRLIAMYNFPFIRDSSNLLVMCHGRSSLVTNIAGHRVYGIIRWVWYLSTLTRKARAMLESIKLAFAFRLSAIIYEIDSQVLYNIIRYFLSPLPWEIKISVMSILYLQRVSQKYISRHHNILVNIMTKILFKSNFTAELDFVNLFFLPSLLY